MFYLTDNCDFAGIWHADYELMSFQVGEEITEDEFLHHLGDKVVALPGGKFFIPTFIEFQYGTLNPQVKAHKSVIEILKKHGLLDKDQNIVTPSKGFADSSRTVQDKDKDTDKETDTDKDQDTDPNTATVVPETGIPDLVSLWNENCGVIPKAMKLTAKRRDKWRARWNEYPVEAYWISVVSRMALSPFCRGETTSWKASVDFLLQPDTHVKVMEGNYDRGPDARRKTRAEDVSDANAALFAAVERGEA